VKVIEGWEVKGRKVKEVGGRGVEEKWRWRGGWCVRIFLYS